MALLVRWGVRISQQDIGLELTRDIGSNISQL